MRGLSCDSHWPAVFLWCRSTWSKRLGLCRDGDGPEQLCDYLRLWKGCGTYWHFIDQPKLTATADVLFMDRMSPISF